MFIIINIELFKVCIKIIKVNLKLILMDIDILKLLFAIYWKMFLFLFSGVLMTIVFLFDSWINRLSLSLGFKSILFFFYLYLYVKN